MGNNVNQNKEVKQPTHAFDTKIGVTTYRVCFHFNQNTNQTMMDQIKHLVNNEKDCAD